MSDLGTPLGRLRADLEDPSDSFPNLCTVWIADLAAVLAAVDAAKELIAADPTTLYGKLAGAIKDIESPQQ